MRLDPASVAADPVVQFRRWFDEAVEAGVRQPDAMALATVRPDGSPQVRTVLLRGWHDDGVAFYTNLESAKGRDLDARPAAALVLHWREQERQVRVDGPVRSVDAVTADAYWATRPRDHQVSAWASPQSEVVSVGELEDRVRAVEARFEGHPIPRPGFWGGFVVVVSTLELWQGRVDRLHDRVRYRRVAGGDAWTCDRLAP